MKTVSLLLALGLLSACSLAPNTPDGVAVAFLKALQDGRFSEAISLVDSETKPQLLSVESICKSLARDQWNLVSGVNSGPIQVTKIDTAKVPAMISYTIAGGEVENLTLRRDGEAWKVHYQARGIFP